MALLHNCRSNFKAKPGADFTQNHMEPIWGLFKKKTGKKTKNKKNPKRKLKKKRRERKEWVKYGGVFQ